MRASSVLLLAATAAFAQRDAVLPRETVIEEMKRRVPEAHTVVLSDWKRFGSGCEVLVARAETVTFAPNGIFHACGGAPVLLEWIARPSAMFLTLDAGPDFATVQEVSDYGIVQRTKRYSERGARVEAIDYVPPSVERLEALDGRVRVRAVVARGSAPAVVIGAEISPDGSARIATAPGERASAKGVMPELPQTPPRELRKWRSDPQVVRNPKVQFEIKEEIGPRQTVGGLVFFAKTFYDGEGMSGVGDIGTFDPSTKKFEFFHVPEMASWSGSAILVTPEAIWVGRKRLPEGAEYGGGLLRFDRATKQVRVYPIPSVIRELLAVGDRVYAGTADRGVFILNGEQMQQVEFVPLPNKTFRVETKPYTRSAMGTLVAIETELGTIEVALDDRAGVTVANFRQYIMDARFDNSSFYRTVTPANQPQSPVKIEVIQGGIASLGTEPTGTRPPIQLERTRDTGILHKDGAISMARGGPDTATTEFFICVGDQPELDFGGKRNPDGQGFAAFGRVVKGMDIVRKIQQSRAEGQKLTPPIRILRVRLLG
jgi:peptidyl-prolyl cis-trans isomerase A (cyclophilin A)